MYFLFWIGHINDTQNGPQDDSSGDDIQVDVGAAPVLQLPRVDVGAARVGQVQRRRQVQVKPNIK